ncbi:MAG: CBS domain-containing protein [Chloroflexi bacterium]|nr:CBS domain-containing protein [Chloroflexota bacterium]
MLLTDHVHQADETIGSIIDPNVPVVRPTTPLETLMGIFSSKNAVVIATGEQVQGILTKIDILDFLTRQM